MTVLKFPTRHIRLPILLLTILTIAPTIVLVIYLNFQQLARSKELQIQRLKNIAQLVASEHFQIVEGARQLLISLSVSPEVKQGSYACNGSLSNLLSQYKRYSNFAVTDAKGNVLCSGVETLGEVNISDRYSFQQVISSKDFAVGEFTISKITNKPNLNFGYPLLDAKGNIAGAVFSSLDLSWLNNLVSVLELDKKTDLLILDRNGTILASNSSLDVWVGKTLSQDPLVKNLASSEGIVESPGLDGIPRLYAIERIGQTESGPYIAIGLPLSSFYNQSYKDFTRGMMITVVIGIVSLVSGWYLGSFLITKVVGQITQVDELKRDFVSLVSHQLRTPLTAIKYFSQILLSTSPGKLTTKQKEFLYDSLESTNRLIFLVGTLLNISKLESGEITLNRQKISIANLIKDVYSQNITLFTQKKLKFIFKAPPHTSYQVLADTKLIAQVISNLLTNAAKYSYSKTKVEIKIIKKKEFVEVAIKNRGFGINVVDKERVFSKFFRGQEASKVDSEGSGLGLYLNKLIIEVHGGKIWFTTGKDITCFYFSIPLNLK